jgi:hypothetical protein
MTEIASGSSGRSGSREKERATPVERPDEEVQARAAELASAQRQAQELVLEQAVQRLRDELRQPPNGAGGQQLLLTARQRLVDQLHDLEQERARAQLAVASRGGEEAAACAVHGVVRLLRGALPAAVTRPDEVIDTAFGLAEQGLQVSRRIALEVVSAARELVAV